MVNFIFASNNTAKTKEVAGFYKTANPEINDVNYREFID
jgi:hypothetical protein